MKNENKDKKQRFLKPRSIKDLFHHPLVSELFGSYEELKRLFLSQKEILQFNSIPIPLEHCLETFRLISRALFLKDEFKALNPLKPDVLPFTGLLHHLYQANSDVSKEIIAEKNRIIWDTLKVYNIIERKIYEQYLKNALHEESLNRKKKSEVIGEPSEQDRKYSLYFNLMLKEELSKLPYRNHVLIDFYILIFFDLYSSLSYFTSNNIAHQDIRILARFVLSVLPSLVGTYSFGEFGKELKDLAFLCIDKSKFLITQSKILERINKSYWRIEITKCIKNIMKRLGIKGVVLSRVKGVFSSYIKATNYNKAVDELWDLIGIRVIIDSNKVDDCYLLLSEIEKKWKRWEHEKGLCDYISSPKENGYQSIHIVLEREPGELIEIQIRTLEMDNNANFGPASHQIYKSKDIIVSASAEMGKKILLKALHKYKLSINDFISHIGIGLKYVPIEHYYEQIYLGKYDVPSIIRSIIFNRKKRKK